jgi:hypothetical protein
MSGPGPSPAREISFEAEKIAVLDRVSTTADHHDRDRHTKGGDHPRSFGSHVGPQTSAVPTVNACYQGFRVPSTGLEPVAYRLGDSVRPSRACAPVR